MGSSSKIVEASNSAHILALSCRWRSRPQHQQQTYAVQQNLVLSDHLVGAQQERFRDGQTQRFRSLEIDDKLEPGRLLDRNLLRALLRTASTSPTAGPQRPGKICSKLEP